MNLDFEKRFNSWLEACLGQAIPDTVKAFSFNLYEPAGDPVVKFGIELVAAGMFSEDDPDWACDEVWEPKTRGISIPVEFSGEEWQPCLQKMKALVLKQLGVDSPAVHLLAVRVDRTSLQNNRSWLFSA